MRHFIGIEPGTVIGHGAARRVASQCDGVGASIQRIIDQLFQYDTAELIRRAPCLLRPNVKPTAARKSPPGDASKRRKLVRAIK